MSYEMKSLRKEDLSLYHYIKDIVLADFIEELEYVNLNLLPESCGQESYVYEIMLTDMVPSPSERGRGIVYFDTPVSGTNCEPFPTYSGLNGDGDFAYGTPEQSNNAILYDGSTIVPWQDYMIDYLDCRIVTKYRLNDPYITFKWNYVSVVDEWAAITAANPPVIVIDVNATDKLPYQLGSGKRVVRKVDIHIFGSNTAERNDIVETLYDGLYLRSCPLYDFSTGAILDYDGTFYGRSGLEDRVPNPANKLTYLFDRGRISKVSSLYFDNVSARHVNLPLVMTRGTDEVMLSDLNAYRSKVSFEMFSYDDRTRT